MDGRTVGLAGLAGVAAFVLVGVAVTELASRVIEFSLFVGIPAGLLFGAAAAILVLARLEDPSPARRRPAVVVAWFGVAFVVALLLGTGLLGLPNSTAILGATIVGALGAAAAFFVPQRDESRL